MNRKFTVLGCIVVALGLAGLTLWAADDPANLGNTSNNVSNYSNNVGNYSSNFANNAGNMSQNMSNNASNLSNNFGNMSGNMSNNTGNMSGNMSNNVGNMSGNMSDEATTKPAGSKIREMSTKVDNAMKTLDEAIQANNSGDKTTVNTKLTQLKSDLSEVQQKIQTWKQRGMEIREMRESRGGSSGRFSSGNTGNTP